jgi:hypothetical protein
MFFLALARGKADLSALGFSEPLLLSLVLPTGWATGLKAVNPPKLMQNAFGTIF